MFNRLRRYWDNRYRVLDENDINYKKAMQFQKKGAVLIDVRSPNEYKEGHLNGAVLIPEYEIGTKIVNMIPNRDKNIVVYCKSGARAKLAMETLNKLGYKNVYNIYNGLDGI